jgi:hypothetical protein
VKDVDQPTGAFAAILGISQLLYISVVLTLGVRLMLLAIRTHRLPESLLAMHFLLCCGLGYLLSIVGLTAVREPDMLSAGAVTFILALAHLGSCVGVFGGICFNFLVFRRDRAWAKGLVALAAVALTTGYVGYGVTGGFSHGRFEGVWFWLFYGTFAWGAAWVMAEPLSYFRTMRKRLQLGLAEPLVANRFLLWGIGSVGRFLMVVGGIIPAVIYADAEIDLTVSATGISLLLVALIGIGVAASYWLTFFPTRGYVRFIDRRHGAAES